MARLPRLTVTGYPHHVILRGNNRQDIFVDGRDRERMLALLQEHAEREGVDIHAYVLMSNHLHLLLTPQQDGALPRLMQSVGRAYVLYFNKRHGRTGTLWEGRYRCAVLQPEAYLLACMAYLDLNPVRAGQVESPADWAWSSHRHYLGQASDRLVTPHPLYWALGNTPFAREQAYAERVAQGVAPPVAKALVASALHGWALGDEGFVAALQKQTGRRLTQARPGRPRTRPAD